MSARFVAPYRRSKKNDGNHVEAICESSSRGSARKVFATDVPHHENGVCGGRARAKKMEPARSASCPVRLAEFGQT
jgi:hypothetical protein